MKTLFKTTSALVFMLFSCASPSDSQINDFLSSVESISGTEAYLTSPYLTPGDKAYMVGHQDGSFPDLGWHVTGEMGGVWSHPIKLMDGFGAQINVDGDRQCLNDAKSFVNYPFANQHLYEYADFKVTRTQFVPDQTKGLYVEYEIENKTEGAQTIEFTFNGFVDLMPVWLGERTNMNNGQDRISFDEGEGMAIGKDDLNNWYVVFRSTEHPKKYQIGSKMCDQDRLGQGNTAALTYEISVPAKGKYTIPFALAGSTNSMKDAHHALQSIESNALSLLKVKHARYKSIEQSARLIIPDKEIETAFRWTKYNTDWLVNDVDGLGRAITAGNPDYPWFFGADSEYALQGAMAIGMKDLTHSSIKLIDSVSNAVNNGSGKIMHEMSTNGAVFNPGNLNETPQYASLIWDTFKWTGDMEFLRQYFPTVRNGLNWLLEENDLDGNLLADGYGMMEIHGLESEMIDVAAYTYKAFVDAASMAEVLGNDEEVHDYQQKAQRLAEIINSEFWVDEFDSYADFIGTVSDADHLVDGAIVRADTLDKPWAVEELKKTKERIKAFDRNDKRGFVLYHNWVVNTPMEVGVADPDKALRALETGSQYVNPFGVFVTGIDRDESAGSDDGGFAKKMKIFSYTGAVMTLPTGVQAIAENNYGRPDKALAYLQRMTSSFSYALPGSMYEVSPDFGMVAQAWNIYSYAVPIVKQFFGIGPMAHLKQVLISPQMPSAWDKASLENISVGDNKFSYLFQRENDQMVLNLTQTNGDYQFVFDQSQFKVEVEKGDLDVDNGQVFLSGEEVRVKLSPLTK